jgi:hypothetical protein
VPLLNARVCGAKANILLRGTATEQIITLRRLRAVKLSAAV